MANKIDTGSEPQCSGLCVTMETTGHSESIVTVDSFTKNKKVSCNNVEPKLKDTLYIEDTCSSPILIL